MKKLFLFFVVAFLMGACNDFNSPQQGYNTDEYYVKYSIKSKDSYEHFSDIYYNDEDGVKNAEKGHNVKGWTVTIGPVKKGFMASVRNEKGTGINHIEVSKNNGPFAEKANGKNSASYTINY